MSKRAGVLNVLKHPALIGAGIGGAGGAGLGALAADPGQRLRGALAGGSIGAIGGGLAGALGGAHPEFQRAAEFGRARGIGDFVENKLPVGLKITKEVRNALLGDALKTLESLGGTVSGAARKVAG